jgi:23S rRNA (guanosine2251-2'-O)-methyltransferase
MLVIGRNPILEALNFNPLSIKKIVLIENLTDNKTREIIRIANKKNIKVESRNKKDFEKIFDKKDKSEGVSQGVLAEVEDYEYMNLETLLEKIKSRNDSAILILDEIQDPHNLGAIIRTSVAAGTDGIILTEKNSAKVNHTVIKASAGAVSCTDIVLSKNIYKTIGKLKESGYNVIGTSLNAETTIYDTDFKGRNVVILGNEGEGVRKNLLKMCNEIIKIPINGKVESLNVSVSAGIILYEVLRQRKLY